MAMRRVSLRLAPEEGTLEMRTLDGGPPSTTRLISENPKLVAHIYPVTWGKKWRKRAAEVHKQLTLRKHPRGGSDRAPIQRPLSAPSSADGDARRPENMTAAAMRAVVTRMNALEELEELPGVIVGGGGQAEELVDVAASSEEVLRSRPRMINVMTDWAQKSAERMALLLQFGQWFRSVAEGDDLADWEPSSQAAPAAAPAEALFEELTEEATRKAAKKGEALDFHWRQMNALQSKLDDANDAVKKAARSSEVEELRGMIKAMAKEAKDAAQRVWELETATQELRGALDLRERQAERQASELLQVETALSSALAESDRSRARAAAFQEEKARAEEARVQAEQAAALAARELEAAQDVNSRALAVRAEMEREARELRGRVAALEGEVEAGRAAVAAAEGRDCGHGPALEQLAGEIRAVREALRQAQARADEADAAAAAAAAAERSPREVSPEGERPPAPTPPPAEPATAEGSPGPASPGPPPPGPPSPGPAPPGPVAAEPAAPASPGPPEGEAAPDPPAVPSPPPAAMSPPQASPALAAASPPAPQPLAALPSPALSAASVPPPPPRGPAGRFALSPQQPAPDRLATLDAATQRTPSFSPLPPPAVELRSVSVAARTPEPPPRGHVGCGDPSHAELARRVEALEGERAELRKEVAELVAHVREQEGTIERRVEELEERDRHVAEAMRDIRRFSTVAHMPGGDAAPEKVEAVSRFMQNIKRMEERVAAANTRWESKKASILAQGRRHLEHTVKLVGGERGLAPQADGIIVGGRFHDERPPPPPRPITRVAHAAHATPPPPPPPPPPRALSPTGVRAVSLTAMGVQQAPGSLRKAASLAAHARPGPAARSGSSDEGSDEEGPRKRAAAARAAAAVADMHHSRSAPALPGAGRERVRAHAQQRLAAAEAQRHSASNTPEPWHAPPGRVDALAASPFPAGESPPPAAASARSLSSGRTRSLSPAARTRSRSTSPGPEPAAPEPAAAAEEPVPTPPPEPRTGGPRPGPAAYRAPAAPPPAAEAAREGPQRAGPVLKAIASALRVLNRAASDETPEPAPPEPPAGAPPEPPPPGVGSSRSVALLGVEAGMTPPLRALPASQSAASLPSVGGTSLRGRSEGPERRRPHPPSHPALPHSGSGRGRKLAGKPGTLARTHPAAAPAAGPSAVSAGLLGALVKKPPTSYTGALPAAGPAGPASLAP